MIVDVEPPHVSVSSSTDEAHVLSSSISAQQSRASRKSRLLSLQLNNSSDKLNQRALTVLTRVQNKLRGRDFDEDDSVNVEKQIELLVQQATNFENLCQAWIGWCPFW